MYIQQLRSMTKRIISIFLVIVFIVSAFSIISVNAEDTDTATLIFTIKNRVDDTSYQEIYSETITVPVGNTIELPVVFNVWDITEGYTWDEDSSQGWITNFDGHIIYDDTVLENYLDRGYSKSDMFPVLSNGSLIVNRYYSDDGAMYFNASEPDGFDFGEDGDILANFKFYVMTADTTDVCLVIEDCAALNDDMTSIVTSISSQNISYSKEINKTVVLDYADGGDLEYVSFEDSYDLSNLPNYDKDGYVLNGWLNSNDEYPVETITESTQLTAGWNEIMTIPIDPDDIFEEGTSANGFDMVGMQIRAQDDETGELAGMRFIMRVGNSAFTDMDPSFGCVVMRKSTVKSYGYNKSQITADIEINGVSAGKDCPKYYDFKDSEYKIFTIVVTGFDDKVDYDEYIVYRPYVKYTDKNGNTRYHYYTETGTNKYGKGYSVCYNDVADATASTGASSGIVSTGSSDEEIALTGSSSAVVDGTVVLGDADRNGEFNIFDATYLQYCLAKINDVDLDAITAAFYSRDVNEDKKITIQDMTDMQKRLALIDDNNIGSRIELPVDKLDGGLWGPVVKP